MPFQIRVTSYTGGEVRWTSSPYRLDDSTGEPAKKAQEESHPEKTRPLLDYCSQLERASRARLSGYGEAPTRKTKFTRAGSLAIQRVARAIDDEAGHPSEILFFTGTLPGTGQEQYEAIAKWSSWMIHRLKAWIAWRLEAKLDFYCWELQKRGALHLHYAVHCPDAEVRAEIAGGIKSEWIRLLDEVSEKTGIDLYLNQERGFSHAADKSRVQADCQEVEKSVGAYLGKYLSKSSNGTTKNRVFTPCRWWGVSRAARELERSKRRTLRLTYGNSNEWGNSIDVLKRILELTSDKVYEWKNKVIQGEGGVGYAIEATTLDEMLNLYFGERMLYADMNAKLRDAWLRLMMVLNEVEADYGAWFNAMSRKHSALKDSEGIKLIMGQKIKEPSSHVTMQHVSWAYRDVLKEYWNTQKPYLPPNLKNRILLLCDDLDAVLMGFREVEYRESLPPEDPRTEVI